MIPAKISTGAAGEDFNSLACIAHPRKEIVPLAVGLSWGNDGAVYQEKLDGRFETRMADGGWRMAGELMPSGEFVAWDLIAVAGEDFRARPTRERLAMLIDACRWSKISMVQSSPDGAALLQAVLARGGEGVVRKLPHATYFDAMQAAKRTRVWYCTVTALDLASGAARVAERMADGTMEDRGTVPLRDRAAWCRVGSTVKVEGENLSAKGMILKPRPCKDTATSWLVKF